MVSSDLSLMKESNRASASARNTLLRQERERNIVLLEEFKQRLRLIGILVATLLSISNGSGAVMVLIYGFSIAISLGFICIAAACAGAAVAIATGVPVKPRDFVAMLVASQSARRDADNTVGEDEGDGKE